MSHGVTAARVGRFSAGQKIFLLRRMDEYTKRMDAGGDWRDDAGGVLAGIGIIKDRSFSPEAATRDLLDKAALFDHLASGLLIADYADYENRSRPDQLHYLGDIAVKEQSALLDDADLIANVGQFGQDMARHHDRLSHLSELLQ